MKNREFSVEERIAYYEELIRLARVELRTFPNPNAGTLIRVIYEWRERIRKLESEKTGTKES